MNKKQLEKYLVKKSFAALSKREAELQFGLIMSKIREISLRPIQQGESQVEYERTIKKLYDEKNRIAAVIYA